MLRQRVRNAINALNRDWNFCSYAAEGSRECKDINIGINCDHYRGGNGNRIRRQLPENEAADGTYVIDVAIPVER